LDAERVVNDGGDAESTWRTVGTCRNDGCVLSGRDNCGPVRESVENFG